MVCQIFWKLDLMESSSRMRRCLRRNYRGSNHLGAAANYEDLVELKKDKEIVISPSKASILVAEAISMEVVNQDEEQEGRDSLEGREGEDEQRGSIQTRLSDIAEQPLQVSVESTHPLASSNQDMEENPSVVAPGYVPSELDERIVLELPASMVRPLRVLRGTFQVSSVICMLSSTLAPHSFHIRHLSELTFSGPYVLLAL